MYRRFGVAAKSGFTPRAPRYWAAVLPVTSFGQSSAASFAPRHRPRRDPRGSANSPAVCLGDHRRPGIHKLLDLAQQARRHRLHRWQDEHPVAHAVGQHEPAVLHAQPGQQHLRRAAVEVIAAADMRRDPPPRRREAARRALGLQIKHVGNKQSLLEQIGSAPDIRATPSIVPTRSGCARNAVPTVPCHAGRAVGPRLRGVAVEDEAVDPFAERPVAEILDIAGMA